MKKLLTAFVTAALLTVCLCVPAFASGVEVLPSCQHIEGLTSPAVLFTDGSSHWIACIECMAATSASDALGVDHFHGSDCEMQNLSGLDEVDLTSDEYAMYLGLCCPEYRSLFSGEPMGDFSLYYSDTDHFLCCNDCGMIVPFACIETSVPHIDDDCELCSTFELMGKPIRGPLPPDSSSIFPSITTLVTASINWLAAFALCIISTPLFLIFVCCIFVGLGIALIKRSIHL